MICADLVTQSKFLGLLLGGTCQGSKEEGPVPASRFEDRHRGGHGGRLFSVLAWMVVVLRCRESMNVCGWKDSKLET